MKTVTCNRGCGTEDLHWKCPDGKYKLFDNQDLVHICEDGEVKPYIYRKKVTASIVKELGFNEPAQIPLPEERAKKVPIKQLKITEPKPSRTFSITTNSTGIAITGNDSHTAIYVSKPAVRDLTKALVDFV